MLFAASILECSTRTRAIPSWVSNHGPSSHSSSSSFHWSSSFDVSASRYPQPLSFAKTPQGPDSGSRNNVTGHSHAYPFQPRFEILTRNRQEGGRYVIDFKDGQNFGEPHPSPNNLLFTLRTP